MNFPRQRSTLFIRRRNHGAIVKSFPDNKLACASPRAVRLTVTPAASRCRSSASLLPHFRLIRLEQSWPSCRLARCPGRLRKLLRFEPESLGRLSPAGPAKAERWRRPSASRHHHLRVSHSQQQGAARVPGGSSICTTDWRRSERRFCRTRIAARCAAHPPWAGSWCFRAASTAAAPGAAVLAPVLSSARAPHAPKFSAAAASSASSCR